MPYTMVHDPGRPETWKAQNSPFYKIMRRRHLRQIRHVDYRGGAIEETIEEGVSTEMSQEFSEKTGITVGVTAGVEVTAAPFGMDATTKVETTVSTTVKLGYSRRYGEQTFRNRSVVAVKYNVPDGHAGVLWSDTHELVAVRGDGLVAPTNMVLNSGSYIGRTYPHTPETQPSVTPLPSRELIEAAEKAGLDPNKLAIEWEQAIATAFVDVSA
nr:hypothetical protein [Carbonactinospora thermoautotrophica]